MTIQLARLSPILLIGVWSLVGCSGSSQPSAEPATGEPEVATEQDPHDIPLTDAQIEALKNNLTSYQVALTKTKGYRDTIRDAIAAGDPPAAHRPLDELDVVLGHLTMVARDNNIPRTDWETVNTSAQQLRDSFNAVHAQIDAGEAPDFQAVESEIDAAISRLESIAPSN